MPQLGETVTEGTVLRWCKQVGELIAVDEALLEVSTDKVDAEVPSPVAGEIVEILVAEGDTVPIGARLAVITEMDVEAARPLPRRHPRPRGAHRHRNARRQPAAPATRPDPTGAALGDGEWCRSATSDKRTAANLTQSLRTAAHTLVAVEVDYEGVNKVRRASGPLDLPAVRDARRGRSTRSPSSRASTPRSSATISWSTAHVNLGIAVDLDFEGLVVPVIRDAQVDDACRRSPRRWPSSPSGPTRKRLSADDLAGGTFTITNAGGFGTLLTGPIINQPQVGDPVDRRRDDAARRGRRPATASRRRRASDGQPRVVVRSPG